ncbi:class I SAM-dependent methyltransferase [Methylobacterium nodulans]|uniref:O-methyltransferase family 3 n=1 Tax=Methylobacterium nodulans (strain LMG 21967 / CNCM I-2342 / ORS 2060) TaxID=460265 RepID=B8IWN9_METNO|nr:class I SAM-dependent methyltransferase [Methylobacterium nodulans]ACL62930.1 O-methyltransferase family 3 [Methylobacterium nodulans ORS 2060]
MTNCIADARSQEYIRAHYTRETPVLRELREYNATRPDSFLQITPDQGAALRMLVGACGAKRILEIGVYTGYSAIWMASVLPEDGFLLACDIDPGVLAIAEPYLRKAGLIDRIDFAVGPAQATLAKLLDQGAEGSFDLAFIDADKEPMNVYYEACLRLVRTGGLIVVDNVLWEGRVADPDSTDPDAAAMRAIAARITADSRVDSCVLSVGDGLLVARKLREAETVGIATGALSQELERGRSVGRSCLLSEPGRKEIE